MRHIALCLVWDLEYLEENKMTLEEKIEVIKAYAEGKPVEAYDTIFRRWFEKGTDTWNFDIEEYRIKSDETTKFAVGDVLVFKIAERELCPTRYKVIGVSDNYYEFDCTSPYSIKEADEDFINERDVLWYFEIYDYATKTYFLAPTRRTMEQMDKEYASNHDTHKWSPVYNLGFKLKEG